jgi:hypothetical protein
MKGLLVKFDLAKSFHPLVQLILTTGFLISALHYRFRVPRYDYWDIAYGAVGRLYFDATQSSNWHVFQK